jgi:replication factor A1
MTNNIEIRDLHDGDKKVNIEGKIVEKNGVREVKSRYGDCTYSVCDAVLADESGTVKLTLWNEQVEQVQVGDNVTVGNGYVSCFKGELQLNVGKYGVLKVN